ncbi:hypothetical protein [Herpetosiphon geysericola]|uniref:Uncharacterized protein n=1 Tax=Herpetosiphon geysericola TaxID=70996 RepID=A0A0P6YHR3_9CHLR|nr:hypothetical protein [Herpetosiphon geysericola]KPL90003.1 hypothetical protein SE18_08605 [Herpetosiphon geysericola]
MTTRSQTLLGRKTLDEARPIGAAILSGVAFIISIATTVACVIDVRDIARPDVSIIYAVLIGFIIAIGLTAAQILTSDVTTIGYLIALAPDAIMTALQLREWLLTPLFNAIMPGSSGVAISWLVGLVVGIISAYIPERLIFGKRKLIKV